MREPLADSGDGVGAGEEQPVIASEADEGSIEASRFRGRSDFKDGDENGCCAECAQLVGECRGLLAGAKDENTAAGERKGSRRRGSSDHEVGLIVGEAAPTHTAADCLAREQVWRFRREIDEDQLCSNS